MDRRRSIIRLAGAAAVTAAALWLAARNAHIDRVRSALGEANFVWLLPYPIICIVLNLIRGEIWRRLLAGRVSTAQAFWAYSVGFLANNVLPFRIGEAARVVVLSRRSELPVVEVAAAAGLERLLDMAALALVLSLTGAAKLLGPDLAGLLTPFPVASSVLAAFAQARGGGHEAEKVLRGMLLALQAFAMFCAALALSLPRLGIYPAFGVSLLICTAVQLLLLFFSRARIK